MPSPDPIRFDDEEELLFDDDLLSDDAGVAAAGDDIDLKDAPVVQAAMANGGVLTHKDAVLRRDVYHGLVHCIVSNPKLWETVDVAEVKELMDAPLAALPAQPLDLAPLWHYMIAKGTPRPAAAETLVFFHSRAERWKITMTLPADFAEVKEERRNVVVEKMSARGVTTGTFIGMNPIPPETEAEKAAHAKKRAKMKAAQAKAAQDQARPALGKLVNAAVRVSLGLSLVVAIVVLALPDGLAPNVEQGAAAALGPLCRSVTQHGHAILCVTDAVVLEDSASIRQRQEIAESALDIEVVFVNDDGEPLALVAPERPSLRAERSAPVSEPAPAP